MRYTENLQLPIIEDTDAFSSLFTMNNETNTKIEAGFGDIPQFKEAVSSIQNDVNTAKVDIEQLKTAKTDLSNRIEVLEDKIKKVEFTERGETKTGELHTIKFDILPTYGEQIYYVKEYGVEEDNTSRIAISNSTISASIDITVLTGVSVVDNIDILSVCAYSKGYYNYIGKTNPMPLSTRTLAVVTPSGDTDVKLLMLGNYTNVVKQTNQAEIGWSPSSIGSQQEGKVTVVLQAIIYK